MNGTQRVPKLQTNTRSFRTQIDIHTYKRDGNPKSLQISLLTAIAIKSEPDDPEPIDVVRALIDKYENTNTTETLFIAHRDMWNRRSEYGSIEVTERTTQLQ